MYVCMFFFSCNCQCYLLGVRFVRHKFVMFRNRCHCWCVSCQVHVDQLPRRSPACAWLLIFLKIRVRIRNPLRFFLIVANCNQRCFIVYIIHMCMYISCNDYFYSMTSGIFGTITNV